MPDMPEQTSLDSEDQCCVPEAKVYRKCSGAMAPCCYSAPGELVFLVRIHSPCTDKAQVYQSPDDQGGHQSVTSPSLYIEGIRLLQFPGDCYLLRRCPYLLRYSSGVVSALESRLDSPSSLPSAAHLSRMREIYLQLRLFKSTASLNAS